MHDTTRLRGRLRRGLPGVMILSVVMALASSALAAPPHTNGFEETTDVLSDDSYPEQHPLYFATRVASGTDGVTSAAGAYHAQAPITDYSTHGTEGFVYTRYGGYSSVFPAYGYDASVDVYLDMADSPAAADIRFDWSSAINNTGGTHRRDFIFHVGTDGSGGFDISVSNNAPGWPSNPANDPLNVTETGWYTLLHEFYDGGGGVLRVDMSVLDDQGTVLKTWTRSDGADIIGDTVGGNRYGWLVVNEFDGLALDNISLQARSGPDTVTVFPAEMEGWGFGFDSGATGTWGMETGPGMPPAGSGSAFMTIGDASTGVALGTAGYDFPGTPFADITAMSYATYRVAGDPAWAIALQFNVDYDLTDATTSWQGRLIYEPYYTETVNTGEWQTWDPFTGANWWASGAIGSANCPISDPCTWDEVLGFWPDAGIHATLGAVLFKAGSNWSGFDGNVDDFVIGVNGDLTRFDFENPLCGGVPVTILGTAGDDILTGTAGVDVISGLDGNDEIDGLGGADILCGDGGLDRIMGGPGADTIYGGTHKDRLFGQAGDDVIYGDEADDKVRGGLGMDTLYGGGGDDVLRGQDDDDLLYGQWGDDLLIGASGADTLDGGPGTDTLKGGSGGDTCTTGEVLFSC